jgi:uncharacterized protein
VAPARRGRRPATGHGVRRSAIAAGIALLSLATAAHARLAVPPAPAGRISDYAGLLTAAERARLEQKLLEREGKSSNQVAVAIFRALDGENLEDYTARLFETWRLGQKGLDNGVLLVVFVDDRRTRIEVGYGHEATLTDAVASGILSQDVAPHFRAGRFADGIERGLDAIDRAIAGTHPAVPEPLDTKALLAVGLFALAFVALAALAARRKRRRRRLGQRPGWTGDHDGWGPVLVPGPVGGGWDVGGSRGGGGGGFGGGGGGSGGGGASGSW